MRLCHNERRTCSSLYGDGWRRTTARSRLCSAWCLESSSSLEASQDRRTKEARVTRRGDVRPLQVASDVFPAFVHDVRIFVVIPMLFFLYAALRGTVVDSHVHLSAKEENRRRDVEVQQQRESGPQAAVNNAVVGEVRQVERETQRGNNPDDHGENGARRDEPVRVVHVRERPVNDRYGEHEQNERDGQA